MKFNILLIISLFLLAACHKTTLCEEVKQDLQPHISCSSTPCTNFENERDRAQKETSVQAQVISKENQGSFPDDGYNDAYEHTLKFLDMQAFIDYKNNNSTPSFDINTLFLKTLFADLAISESNESYPEIKTFERIKWEINFYKNESLRLNQPLNIDDALFGFAFLSSNERPSLITITHHYMKALIECGYIKGNKIRENFFFHLSYIHEAENLIYYMLYNGIYPSDAYYRADPIFNSKPISLRQVRIFLITQIVTFFCKKIVPDD